MKKIYSILLAAAATLSASADAPTLLWGNIFDGNTSGGDQNTAIALDNQDGVYWYNTIGSNADNTSATYGTETLYNDGAPLAGTGNNGNLCITKTDADGKLLWSIHSTSGDFASNQGNLVAAPDGSRIYFSAKVRHTDGFLGQDLALVDGQGTTTYLDWKLADGEKRYYRLMTGCADATGKLLWANLWEVGNTLADGTTFVADAIISTALALDADGNLYVGGRQQANIGVPTATGYQNIAAQNVQAWDGKSTTAAGSLFIVKLDADGNYLGSLLPQGSAAQQTISALEFDSTTNKIFFYGNATEGRFKLGTKEIITNENLCPLLGSMSPDFTVVWAKYLPTNKIANQLAIQSSAISVYADTLWLTAQFNGQIFDNDNDKVSVATAGGSPREGALIKFNKTTGEWLAGTTSRAAYPATIVTSGSDLTGYLKAIENPTDAARVYVFGYVMNAQIGAFLRPYNPVTMASAPEDAWNMVTTTTGTPTACNIAYQPATGRAYMTLRGNQAFKAGDTTTAKPATWAIYATCFQLPQELIAAGVDRVVSTTATSRLTAAKGRLSLSADATAPVAVYSVAGTCVAILTPGQSVNLAPGLYITPGQKYLVK